MEVYDFLSRELIPGAWVAFYGGGNGKAAYGMCLGRVIKADPDKNKVQVERISVEYPDGQTTIRLRNSWHSNPNALVRIDKPHPYWLCLYLKLVRKEEFSAEEKAVVARWIHGVKPQTSRPDND